VHSPEEINETPYDDEMHRFKRAVGRMKYPGKHANIGILDDHFFCELDAEIVAIKLEKILFARY
jgi:hypothetical protein